MGSGSSRSGRALRRLRSPDSRPAGPGGATPEGGTGPPVSVTAAAAAREEAWEAAAEGAAGPGPGPAAPPDGGDETLRLLDQLLAESAAWGPGELAPRGPARPRPATGTGSPVSPKWSTEDHPESSSVSEDSHPPLPPCRPDESPSFSSAGSSSHHTCTCNAAGTCDSLSYLFTLSRISGPSQHQAQSGCFTDAAEGNVWCEPGPVGLDPQS
ncbi:cystin-1 isoform X2 [Tursiops truncatus]|uniref:cystin-1 isoform X2 n=1 Tax=Tursiops truncatus TaxID=9739 RepID=UPI003CCF62C1